MIDSYGRDIDYLRISITDLCNLKCKYCMPETGVCKKQHDDMLRIEEIEKIAKAAVELGFKKIRLTGGEPLVRKGIIELIEKISKLKPLGLKEIGLTTNGMLLEEHAESLKKAGLTRVNVSIDSLNKDKFNSITRHGDVSKVLNGIKAAKRAGLDPIKLNVVLIGGFNDDEIQDFVNLTINDDIDVRFIELMPIGEAASWSQESFISGTEILNRVPKLIPMPFKGHGTVARMYKLPNSKGRVGIISPLSSHFCEYCNRIRITPDGKLKPCLHSNAEVNIKDYSLNDLKKFLIDGIKLKPVGHCIKSDEYIPIDRNMNEIGG